MNRPARFTVADLRRALRAADSSGRDFAVEITPDGTIRIVRNPGAGTDGRRPIEPQDEIVL